MIKNATLLRIDRSSGASGSGKPLYTNGPAISVRCLCDAISAKMRISVGMGDKDAQKFALVPKSLLSAAGEDPPAVDDRLLVAIDQGDPAGELAIIVSNDNFQHGSLSHFQFLLNKV